MIYHILGNTCKHFQQTRIEENLLNLKMGTYKNPKGNIICNNEIFDASLPSLGTMQKCPLFLGGSDFKKNKL